MARSLFWQVGAVLLGSGLGLSPVWADARQDFGEQAAASVSANWRPEVLERPELSYPRRALMMGLEGRCEMTFQVDRSGRPSNIDTVCDPEGHFENAVAGFMDGLRLTAWPGPEDLSPQFRLPLSFQLAGGSSAPSGIERVEAPGASTADTASTEGGDSLVGRLMCTLRTRSENGIGVLPEPNEQRLRLDLEADVNPAGRAATVMAAASKYLDEDTGAFHDVAFAGLIIHDGPVRLEQPFNVYNFTLLDGVGRIEGAEMSVDQLNAERARAMAYFEETHSRLMVSDTLLGLALVAEDLSGAVYLCQRVDGADAE